MTIQDVISALTDFAPLSLQESYDNSGLIVGDPSAHCKGALLSIDITEEVIQEAIQEGCNLIISHHPLIFSGLTSIRQDHWIGRCVISAVQHNISIAAMHTNYDNILRGVSGYLASVLGLKNITVLHPMDQPLLKLVTFVPSSHKQEVSNALFDAGCGTIGAYDRCSFNMQGEGTFRAGKDCHPYCGDIETDHIEEETRIEMILPSFLKNKAMAAIAKVHPYEEPVIDFYRLDQKGESGYGCAIVADVAEEMDERSFLESVKKHLLIPFLKHSPLLNKRVRKVAICGGSGSFLLPHAIEKNVDVFLTGDIKYHDYFEAKGNLLMVDIGHFESEQFTNQIFYNVIRKRFPTFAPKLSKVCTNPINYL